MAVHGGRFDNESATTGCNITAAKHFKCQAASRKEEMIATAITPLKCAADRAPVGSGPVAAHAGQSDQYFSREGKEAGQRD
jgi:hypothetical protein